MVGANWRGLFPAMPMLEGFQFMVRSGDPANSKAIRQGKGTQGLSRFGPLDG
jgi:hypothetical protein